MYGLVPKPFRIDSANTPRYMAAASAFLHCCLYKIPRLCTVANMEVWSGPQAFSLPANARRYIASLFLK